MPRTPPFSISRTAVVALLILATTGCSADPKKIRLTDAPPDAQLASLRLAKGLTVDETRLLYGYFARIRLESVEGVPPNLSGRTVGELIDEQRRWEQSHADLIAERQRHDSDWRARANQVVREMETALSVRIVDIRDPDATEATHGSQRSVIVRLAIENVGNRTIIEVEGAVRFSDVYGRDLFDGTVVLREPLPPGEAVERVLLVDCVPFMDQETHVRQVRLADTRAAWEPRLIRFEDGGVLAMSDE